MSNDNFIEGIHFYFDESGLMALTEKYHLEKNTVAATVSGITLIIMRM